jgi:hypothetical protein
MTAQVSEIIMIDGQQHRLCALPLTPLFRSWHPEPLFIAESSANWRGYQGTWEIIGTDLFLTAFSGILEQNSDPAESAAVGVLDVEFLDVASNPADLRDKAAICWKQAVAHLDSLPKDEHGESISDQTHPLFGDDTGFIADSYCGNVDFDAVMNADDAPVFASWFTGLLRILQGKLLKYVHGGFGSLQERDLIISIESGVVARLWRLNYIPALFAQKPAAAQEVYSLIAMKPRLRTDARDQTLMYLAAPFKNSFADAVSSIFQDKMSSLYAQRFMVSDLVKVAIRTTILEGLEEGQMLSEQDQAARRQYDETIRALDRAFADAGKLLRGESPRGFSSSEEPESETGMTILKREIPHDREAALEWAGSVLKNAEPYVSAGNFLRLGVACRLTEDELRR